MEINTKAFVQQWKEELKAELIKMNTTPKLLIKTATSSANSPIIVFLVLCSDSCTFFSFVVSIYLPLFLKHKTK